MASSAVVETPSVSAEHCVEVAARWFLDGRRLDMQGIADELGVSRATLFRRVGGREELLSRALWQATERSLAVAARRWERERAPGDPHTLGSVRNFNLIVSRSAGLRRLLDDEPTLAMRVLTDPRGRIQTGIVETFEDLLRRDIAEFDLAPTIEPSALAYAIVRIGESFLYADVLAARHPDVAMADRIQRALLEGLWPSLRELSEAVSQAS
jgi:AcrR family transcriptional regulator